MQWALVSGASSGIGLEFAKILAKAGYNTILVARRRERLEKLKAELESTYSIQAKVIVADLCKPEDIQRVYDESSVFCEHLTVLINNAGLGDYGFFTDSDLDKDLNMIDLNIRSLTHMTKLFSKDMIKAKSGYICNVASMAAFQPGPIMAVYCATKAYVLSFSQAIGNEFKDHGIYVSALCPGPTESEFGKVAEVSETGMMKDKKLPTAYEVAEFGFKKMLAKNPVAIPGAVNKILAQSNRLAPRRLGTYLARKVIESA